MKNFAISLSRVRKGAYGNYMLVKAKDYTLLIKLLTYLLEETKVVSKVFRIINENVFRVPEGYNFKALEFAF